MATAVAMLVERGSRCVYHPVTFGHLLGEVVRRVTGDSVGRSVGKGNFGHTGWGGSVGFADPSRRLGFAFVTNRLLAFEDGVDPRRQRLLDVVDAAL